MTLARLQQCTTLALVAAACAWATGALWAGRPWLAVSGAVLIVFFYACVLAIEFLCARAVHGADPAPRAGARQLARAWWGEVRAAPRVFNWRQPFRSGRHDDHLPASARGRRGVLLVHGFVCNRGLWNPWLDRLAAADVPFVAINLEPVFGAIDAYEPIIERGVRALEEATGLSPVIVAHSMGGLAVRRWWAERDGDDRIHHAITIGTPHHGTWLARFAFSANGRQMRRDGAWLKELAARESSARYARYTCYYGHCDNIVFPPSTATLPGADNRHLAAVAHVDMANRAEPWQTLMRLLDEPVPGQEASAERNLAVGR